jgi:DNA helicase-2/ATP-dependent DNA helicase PcrA
VFVLSAFDGCIPSHLGTGTTAELKEERQLLYVAITRAKVHQHLVVPQCYTLGQAARGCAPCDDSCRQQAAQATVSGGSS